MIRMILNNIARTNKDIENSGRTKDIEKFKQLIIQRSKALKKSLDNHNDRRYSPSYAKFIKEYKDDLLLSMKQTHIDPITSMETWTITDRDFLTMQIELCREIGELGTENIILYYMYYQYKDLRVMIRDSLFNGLGINNAYNEIARFVKLFSDYTEEINKEGGE